MYFVCILGEDVMFFREVAKITTTYLRYQEIQEMPLAVRIL